MAETLGIASIKMGGLPLVNPTTNLRRVLDYSASLAYTHPFTQPWSIAGVSLNCNHNAKIHSLWVAILRGQGRARMLIVTRLSADDCLRLLDDKVAIPLYCFFELWCVLLSGTAGPVAVATGAHMTRTHPSDQASQVAFGVATICMAPISILGTISKLWSPSTSISWFSWIPESVGRQRRLVSDRWKTTTVWANDGSHNTHSSYRRWRIEAPDFCGGVIVSTMISIILIGILILPWFAVPMAFGAGLTALAMKLLDNDGEMLYQYRTNHLCEKSVLTSRST